MANERTLLRAATCLAFGALIAACSAAPAASPVPSATAVGSPAAPSPTASPEPSLAVAPSSPPATLEPTPKPRPSLGVDLAEIAAYMTSSITLLNLGDDDLSVVVSYVDPESGAPFPLGAYALGSMDHVTNDAPPGTYLLEFRQPGDATAATTCTIQMADSDGYVFAALGGAIAITSSANPPTSAPDAFVATSPLCVD